MNYQSSIKEFESRYGSLQEKYNSWRRVMEEKERCGAVAAFYTDCAFEEARVRFSDYCKLEKEIPFDVMLSYENRYVKGGSINDGKRKTEEGN